MLLLNAHTMEGRTLLAAMNSIVTVVCTSLLLGLGLTPLAYAGITISLLGLYMYMHNPGPESAGPVLLKITNALLRLGDELPDVLLGSVAILAAVTCIRPSYGDLWAANVGQPRPRESGN